MSPRVEVYVPVDQMQNFQTSITSVEGAKITTVSSSPKDYQAELLSVLEIQAARLAQFRDESDSQKQAVIVSGIRDMLYAVGVTYRGFAEFPPSSTITSRIARLSTAEEIATAKEVLSDIFLENTRREPRKIVANNSVNALYEIDVLNPREVEVLMMRFGLTGEKPLSLRGTATSLGFKTGERIRQIEAKALRKLRHPKNFKRIKGAITEEVKTEE